MTIARVESIDTPLGRVLANASGKRTRLADGSFLICCPAHRDSSPSLSVSVGRDGRVLLNCHAGCATDSVVGALGLEMKDLFADERAPITERVPKRSHGLTLDDLAAHKQLPRDFLAGLGWRDENGCVAIPYLRRDGSVQRVRIRSALIAKDGSRWGPGDGQIAYEPDRGELARAERYLIVVEGETDTATLLYAGFPALGVPGAKSTSTVQAEHLEGIERVFMVRETDDAGGTFVDGLRERLKALHFEGDVVELRLPGAAKDSSTLYLRSPSTFAEAFSEAMREAVAPKPPAPGLLDSLWRTVGEWNSLAAPPPPRAWLLDREDEETNGMTRAIGVLPLGKAGLFVAPGGVGKTLALVQLALAVATGRQWLGCFGTPNPGRVLVMLAEEDAEEIWRRMYSAAQAMRLTVEQEALAASNIVAVPLAGMPVAFLESEGGAAHESAILAELRRRLGSQEWRLIILDPLSRFAGTDTEKDNAAATRFVQVAESLTKAPGSPTVLIAHHTNKTSRSDDSSANAAHARGASGLVDGVRWVANLESVGTDGARFTITKSNYGPAGLPVMLVRDFDHGGYLRVATAEESARRAAAAEAQASARAKEQQGALQQRVLDALTRQPGMAKKTLAKTVHGRGQDVGRAVDELFSRGAIRKAGGHGFEVVPRSSEPLPGTSDTPAEGGLPRSSQVFPEEDSKGLPGLPTPLGGEDGKSCGARNTTSGWEDPSGRGWS